MPEGLGPWPPLVGVAGVFFYMVKLALNYQATIGERYGKEIERLDAELKAARAVNDELRARVELLENTQGELRYLRRVTNEAGIFNPWTSGPGVAGDHG